MLETDLYEPIREFLEAQGYTVHSEVKNCDITAIRGDELVVVEMKTAFNLKLLVQGVKRQRIADSVYLAIPLQKGGKRSQTWNDMCLLLRNLELGLIVVDTNKTGSVVEVVFHPHTFDRLKSKASGKRQRRHIIKEATSRYTDFNKGGSNRRRLMTAYRENSVFIACCLMRHGSLSPSALKKLGTGAKTQSILSKNFYGWFEKLSKGLYRLSPCAEKQMEEYVGLVKHYMDKLDSLPQASEK